MRGRLAVMVAIAGVIGVIAGAPDTSPRGDARAGDERLQRPIEATVARVERTPIRPAPRPEEVRLTRFASCEAFADHLRERAIELVGPTGLDALDGWDFFGGAVFASSDGAGTAAFAMPGLAPASPIPDGGFSTTNTQVSGVDEPDILKTDGRTIYWLGRRTLHAVAVDGGGGMRRAGSIKLPMSHDASMLLARDRIMVFSGSWRSTEGLRPGPTTRIAVVDVSDPDSMRLAWKSQIEGSSVAARMIDGTARVVIRSGAPRALRLPGTMGWTGPDVTNAIERNQRRLARTPTSSWIPRIATTDDAGTRTERLVDCTSLYAPPAFSGFDTVSVVTMDPADPDSRHAASVLGGAQTVYATSESMFVATSEFVPTSERRTTTGIWTTQIHSFDITDPAGASYRASGEVEGTLKDQWALDVYEGHLRVASTVGAPWDPTTESMVTVLREQDGRWIETGRVGGMGEGERIYAVRFMGARGYVVTYRVIDPLYTLDLSDPADPRVAGELKIPGYSAYLHPVADDLLLGVGQAATTEGRLRGSQVSLFDVSDPAKPQRIDRLALGTGSSEVEYDHHAFLFWPTTGTLVLPVVDWSADTGAFTGAVGVRVADRRLTEIGRVSHQRGALEQMLFEVYRGVIRRTAVVGDTAFTLSDQGMLASDVRTFDERGWLGWQPRFRRVGLVAGRGPGLRDGYRRTARFHAPTDLEIARDGGIWVADTKNRAVRWTTPWGEAQTLTVRAEDGSVTEAFPGEPVALASDRSDLFVATRCAVWRAVGRDPATVSLVAGARDCDAPELLGGPADGEGGAARFGEIAGLARAQGGSLLVADAGAHAIRRIRLLDDGTAVTETVAGVLGESGFEDGTGAGARLRDPRGITVLPDGEVLVADTGNHVLRALTPVSWTLRTIAGTPGRPSTGRDHRLTAPIGIAYDPVAERLYVTEGGVEGARGHRVRVIEGTRVRTIAGDGVAGLRGGERVRARFRSPTAVLVVAGELIVADRGNDRLRRVR